MPFRVRILALSLSSMSGLAAAEVTLDRFAVPVFDSAGHMTHKLTAKRATAATAQQRLEGVEIVYFSADGDGRVVQRVQSDDARWNAAKQTLTGTGLISVETGENRLSGRGFDFVLATSVLDIRQEFKMAHRDFTLTSDRAVVDLLVERAGDNLKLRDVKRCEATGHLHLVVQPPARKKFPFDEAFSENAIYDGGARTIEFPHPVRGRSDQGEFTSASATIRL